MAIRCSTSASRLRVAPINIDPGSGSFTLFGWGKQVEAWTGGTSRQTFAAFFTGGSEDFSDAYIRIVVADHGGGKLALELGGGTIAFADPWTPLPPLNTWFWWGVTYDSATFQFTYVVNGNVIGVVTRDYSGVGAITSALFGGDGVQAGSHVAVAYVRAFQSKLTVAELTTEATKPLAAVDAVEDHPLHYVGDLTDYSTNGSAFVIVGAPESDFQGPFGNPTAFAYATAPEATDLFFYDKDCRLIAVTPAPHPTTERLVAVCPTRSGHVWAAYDVVANRAAAATSSVLRKILPATGAILTTTAVAFVVAELRGRKALFELPSTNLLTVNRTTHALTSLNPMTGAVVQTFSLVIDPLDAALNADGTRLLYTTLA